MNCECDCPICLDAIIGLTNKTTTECGHHFHTKCLMQNAAHNGFGCPYCRNTLAENPNDDDSLSESDDDSFLEEEQEEEDYILRGVRWFYQRNNDEEIDNDGLEEENAEVNRQEDEEHIVPLEDVKIKLKLAGITYDQLVEYVLSDYLDENHLENITKNKSYKKVYTKLREIDANFRRNVSLNSNRNTDYYEEFINEYPIPIN
jgi:hypothetical protein